MEWFQKWNNDNGFKNVNLLFCPESTDYYQAILKANAKYRFNSAFKKWELCDTSDDYLCVSDMNYFKTIREAMSYIFNKHVASQGVFFHYNELYDVWFPQPSNDKWINELSEDGQLWYEKPIDSKKYDSTGKLRYAFIKEKHGYRFTGVFKFLKMDGQTRVYEMVDDKVLICGKKSYNMNMIICNIAYMKYYKGITDFDQIYGGGGKYPTQKKDGGEKKNFLPTSDGFTYGFVETNYLDNKKHLGDPQYAKTIHVENINPVFKNKNEATNVRVVFISKLMGNGKHVVVGWYDNAIVFRKRQRGANDFGYNIKCKNEDAHLIEEDKRIFNYPKKNEDGTYNFGQANVSYPYDLNTSATLKLVEKLNEYLNNL